MSISEGNYNSIIEEMSAMANNKDAQLKDNFAVAYCVLKKLGDRNAGIWLSDLKSMGDVPVEWTSLFDGIYKVNITCKDSEMDALEKCIKSQVGVSMYSSKQSLFQKIRKRKLRKDLNALVDETFEHRNSEFVAHVYKLVALYSLIDGVVIPTLGIFNDETYKLLPRYVRWIEEFVWR
jgi:hypothetical protein